MIDHAGNVVRIGGHEVERRTLKGIQTASAESGVSFHYLLAKAAQESGFDSSAKASTSSATGLFQFTRGTWLDMMRKHGGEIGFGDFASQIKESATGRLTVLNEAAEMEMLALRRDPDVSSQFAAFFAGDNAKTLETALGREASPAELYFAHFLGAWGATALVTTAEQNPTKPAVDVLPAAAHANKTVFFEDNGLARTAAGVIDWLKNKFSDRLSETADVAALFEPGKLAGPSTPDLKPQFVDRPNSPFDMGYAARSGDAHQMGVSMYLLQMLAEMFSAQPMQMVDDPFAMQPSGFGKDDWGSVLSQVFESDMSASAATAERAYRAADGVPIAPPKRRSI
ncbi:MAG: hypothetical protein RIF37_12140 [Rhodospirillaceae bacterium]